MLVSPEAPIFRIALDLNKKQDLLSVQGDLFAGDRHGGTRFREECDP